MASSNVEEFAKGKRSVVYKQGNVIIKTKREGSMAVGRLQNEAKWLKILNKHKIGPNFIKFENGKLFMGYVKGPVILEYCKDQSGKKVRVVLLDLLEQCYIMDKLKVNKYEMHKPVKHVIIKNEKPVLIDFERCKKTLNPKNVTQVCQFYARYFGLKSLLPKAKAYKENYSPAEFKAIKICVMKEMINMS
jgi:putative serine/threonine protein kinase